MSENKWTVSVDKPWCIIDERGAVIATTGINCAAMMVREHNAHEDLVEALDRQADNMAFLLNHATIMDPWYSKFTRELAEDRAALSQARA